jgi:hypothetical protein
MHYTVIFDIAQTKYEHWSDLGICFVFVAIAIGCWLQRRKANTGWLSFSYSILMTLFLLVWSLFPLFMVFERYKNYQDIKAALQQSRCDVADGVVTNFSHFSYGKRANCYCEIFSVNGKKFKHVDGSQQNGFHQTGIIRDGMQVRIYYYDWHDTVNKDIARLEIAP